MSNMRIILPEKELFRCPIKIRIDDINYGGHLGNERILSYCQETRLAFLQSLNQSEQDFLGTGLIMRSASVVYRSEGFCGDILDASLMAQDIWRYGFDFVYCFRREEVEIARAQTGLIYFDYAKRGKLEKNPEEVAKLLGI